MRRTDAKRPVLRSPFHSEFFVSAGFFPALSTTTDDDTITAFGVFVFHDLPVSPGVLNLRHQFAGESRDVISARDHCFWEEKIGTETTCYSTFTTRTLLVCFFFRLVGFLCLRLEPGGCKISHQTCFPLRDVSSRGEREKRGKGGILSFDFGLDGVFSAIS
jgi:hypothetical protein